MFLNVKRLYSSTASLSRRILPIFLVLIVVYIILYLLWTKPASHEAIQKRRDRQRLAAGRHHIEHQRGTNNVDLDLGLPEQANQDGPDLRKFSPHWRGVWIPDRRIQVMSVIRDVNYLESLRLVLPSFLQHSAKRDFFCCIHWSADLREFLQVPAQLDYIDLRFMVELQASTFECKVKQSEMLVDISQITHVSFATQSCDNPTLPMEVVSPERRKFEFAVCTKVAYGRLEPQRLVEWFSFMEEVGVSKYLVFYNNLHHDSKTVLDYYVKSGHVELIHFDPRNHNGKSVQYTEANAQTRQAQQDKTLAVRDSQYRLAGYDFVLTIDFDELPVPIRPYGSINWVLQDMLRSHPDASAFYMDPYLMPPEWLSRPKEMLHHFQFTKGVHLSPHGRKWAYIPSRTSMAATHQSISKDGYKVYPVSETMLHFLHFRSCKGVWADINCTNITSSADEASLLRFHDRVLEIVKKLPLKQLIPPAPPALNSGSKESLADFILKETQGKVLKFDNSILFGDNYP